MAVEPLSSVEVIKNSVTACSYAIISNKIKRCVLHERCHVCNKTKQDKRKNSLTNQPWNKSIVLSESLQHREPVCTTPGSLFTLRRDDLRSARTENERFAASAPHSTTLFLFLIKRVLFAKRNSSFASSCRVSRAFYSAKPETFSHALAAHLINDVCPGWTCLENFLGKNSPKFNWSQSR